MQEKGLDKEVDLVKQVYDTESKRKLAHRDRSQDGQRQFNEVLDIARRYKKEVVSSLYSTIRKIYQEAQGYLQVGFMGLPDFDDINRQYYEILFKTLNLIWQQFCLYGEIEEI